MGWWLGGWLTGLSKTKTKPNPKLKFELKFGAELCNIFDLTFHKWTMIPAPSCHQIGRLHIYILTSAQTGQSILSIGWFA